MRGYILAIIISSVVGGIATGTGLYVYTSGRLELSNREIAATKESLARAEGRIKDLESIGDGLREDNKQLRESLGLVRGKVGGIGDSISRSERLNDRSIEINREAEEIIAKYTTVQ